MITEGGGFVMRAAVLVALAALCAGCVTTESVQFQPTADQQSIVRDGRPGLVSTRKNSIVIARPAARQLQIGGRPVFVLAIYNRSSKPLNFRVADVSVTQTVNGGEAQLKVITYEELVQEEQTRQTFRAIGAGLAAAGNSISASQAGYYHSNSTVYAPGGMYQVSTTGYSPTAAAIAQANANATNAELIGATIERGQANMAFLERAVIKDNTLMPGEWYGGQLHIQPLISQGGPIKYYKISVQVGPDRHEIQIAQGTPQSWDLLLPLDKVFTYFSDMIEFTSC
jgi:hypothetical protein